MVKIEICLLTLNRINQCFPTGLKNLLRNENDLHNHNARNAINRQLALSQVIAITDGLFF